MPQFSIITICLNEKNHIRETCESTISRTFDDYGWIIIDGGSTDGTLDILQAHEKHAAHFVSKPDGGIHEAMNKGVLQATGQYVVFMNAGDCFASRDTLTMAATTPQEDLICGDIFVNEIGGTTVSSPDTLDTRTLCRQMIHHQARFIRRSLFDEHGLYDCSCGIGADYEFFMRLHNLLNRCKSKRLPF